jgi:hypothetical protein
MGTHTDLTIHNHSVAQTILGKQSASRIAWGSPQNYNIFMGKNDNSYQIVVTS